MRDPVDAVITWVDGHDDAHATKLANYFTSQGISRPETAAPTRFNQCGEIDYCVNSLLRYAPWIRTIYIVTDEQTPSLMKRFVGTPQQNKLKLVDHRDIFRGYEQFLPTFNSMTIESMLWRINGLSDHFIYLNDDCSMIRPVTQDDFFRGNKIVLRGHWRRQSNRAWSHYFRKLSDVFLKKSHDSVTKDPFRTVQEKSAQLAGCNTHFFQLPHAPFPLRKASFEDCFFNYREAFKQNLSYATRNAQQFWALSLVQHLEIKQKNVVFDHSLKAITVNGACHSLNKIQHRLALAERKRNVAFICMQSMDVAPKSTQTIMLEWLKKNISQGE